MKTWRGVSLTRVAQTTARSMGRILALSKNETAVGFEEERFAYCEKLYNLEYERKERIEKKASFLFAIVGLILGAISIKGGLVSLIVAVLDQKKANEHVKILILSESVLFVISMAITLIYIILAVIPQTYRRGYPRNIVSQLFSPESGFHDGKSRASFLRSASKRYAIALEVNSSTNWKKSQRLSRASFGLIATFFFLSCLAATVIFSATG